MSTRARAVATHVFEWRQVTFVWPILAVIAVFVCVEVLRSGAQLTSPSVTFCLTGDTSCTSGAAVELQRPGSNLEVVSKDLPGRLQIIAAGAVFLASFGALVWLSALSIYRCRRALLTRTGRLLTQVAAVILMGLVVWLALKYHERDYSLLLQSYEHLVNAAIESTGTPDHAGRRDPVTFTWTYRLTGALALLSAVILALTSAVIVYGVSSEPDELPELRERCAALRLMLASGAAVLASAVIVVRTLQRWALSLTADAEPLQAIADSWTLALGTYWTLVLIAAFVPSAAIVHRAALDMADRRPRVPGDGETREQWLDKHDLNVSMKQQITRILLLLAPWLSGSSLTEIGSAFFS